MEKELHENNKENNKENKYLVNSPLSDEGVITSEEEDCFCCIQIFNIIIENCCFFLYK
jgi:hypothetical protein